MKRKIFSMFAASALLMTVPAIAEASSASAATPASGKVDRPVNFRSAPSASEGSVYRTLQPGTKFEVLSELSSTWIKVSVGGTTGYVSSSYVTYSKPAAPIDTAKTSGAQTASAAKPVTDAKAAADTKTPAVKPAAASASKPASSVSQASAKPAASTPAASPVKTVSETPAPAAAVAPADGTGVVTKNVNFRAEPTTGSDVYRVLSAGESFTVVELTNASWIKIADGSGVSGYVSTGYVTYAGGSVPVVQVPPTVTPAVPAVLPVPSTGDLLPQPVLPQLPDGSTVSPGAADRVIANALSLQGITHYGFGKNVAPVLFDCSSFTSYVFGLEGVQLPLGTAYQKDIGTAVDKNDWQKGDLLFFWSSIPGVIGHVGIYDGNGNLVHNSASKDGVVVSPLDLKYWQDHYVSARRVLP
ncbi:SH3 domain-containing protein [Saccharibacillus sp. CPCC 101409]|uniref:C40 family peptidase n=1 Tax=Saccharibacillus sp. CPCC 101409 TaxID=3058041 RepID=UPI002671E5CA|nr:C40 family peptidase [Saccharibacillus sp. CPCC 101409]MDO3410108.1 SH3 domain-containing protein [Saccharibacillus sp. CPCC 101409]